MPVLYFDYSVASSNNHRDLVEILLNNKANANAKNNEGWSSLALGDHVYLNILKIN